MADLITSARAKYNLNNLTTTAAEDTTIAALVTACSKAVRRYCRREFDSQSFTEYHTGRGETHLVLRQFPIVSVTSVTVDEVEIDSDDYTADDARGILYRSCGWHSCEYGIVVVYTAGYSTVPEDVQEACAEWVAQLFFQTKRDPGLASESVPGLVSRVPASVLPPTVKQLLAPYRSYPV